MFIMTHDHYILSTICSLWRKFYFFKFKDDKCNEFILELRVWFEDELFSWESTPSQNFSHSSTGYETCTSLKLNGGWYVTIARTQRFVNIIRCWKKTEQNKKNRRKTSNNDNNAVYMYDQHVWSIESMNMCNNEGKSR